MKKFIFLLPFLFFIHKIFSQEIKNTNSMLWRITGNGLSRPSYLFGTIHLTDKRVFQLGDSVYKALEQTDGFAAELDMNSIGTQMINFFIRQEEEKNATEPVKLKDVLNAETWSRYKDILSKKIGKKPEKITVDDLDEIESRFQADILKKGEMPTFLDAWFFGQARKSGKWVGGIEDLQDQLEHKDDIEGKIQMALFDDDYYRNGVDRLMKMYIAQQLDSIDAFMYREGSGRKDYIMIKRNLKMSRRIDSLSAIRSTLFAVGAGHLPGDSGVIALLRERGFTVTPVFSSKRMSADKYVAKTVMSQWFPLQVRDSAYALKMPGIAEGFEFFESLGMDMKFFFDMSFMRLYLTVNIDVPEERKKLGYDSLYNGMKQQFAKKGKLVRESNINVNGTDGREYYIGVEKGEMRMQIFLPKLETVVINAVFAFKDTSLKDEESEMFLQSFTYNKNRILKPVQEKGWTKYNYNRLAFSVEMPVKPRETKDVAGEEGMISYAFQALDIKEQIFYGINISTMKKGMYASENDEAGFERIKENLTSSMQNAEVLDSSYITVGGYSGYRLAVKGATEGETIITKILSVPRGGISYYLYVVYNPSIGESQNANAERFLSSFILYPYNYPEWERKTAPDGRFSTVSPYSMTVNDRDNDDVTSMVTGGYLVYDTIAYVTSYIDRTVLPKWLWYSSDTGFLRKRSEIYYSYNDSIADYESEVKENMAMVSFAVIKKGDNLVKKVKLLLNGDELYELYGYFNKHDFAANYNRFFDDFTILQKLPKRVQLGNGVKELAKVLESSDIKSIEQVKSYWDVLKFGDSDIPVLRAMMLKQYPDFDTSYSNNLNKKIFDRLVDIDSNFTSVFYFGEQYGLVQPKDEYIKPLIVSFLSKALSDTAYGVLKKCLLNYPMMMKDNLPYFYHSFYDSLELTAKLFPEMMKEAGRKPLWDIVCGITSKLVDSGLLTKSAIRDYAPGFITTAKRILEEEKRQLEEGGYGYADLIRVLGMAGTPETGKLLIRFSKIKNQYIKFRTLISMLECNMPVDENSILAMAVSDEFRHDLYDELKRINKLKLFPAAFCSQKELGRSKLHEYATEDEYDLNQLVYLGEKIVEYKGLRQKFHLYKIVYTGEDEEFLGVAGPYSLNPGNLSSSHEATGLFWDGVFDKKRLEQLLKEYLEELQGDE